jgi:hypothetical protein
MNNPQMTFKNIQQLIELGYGNNLPNNKNKFPNWLTLVINLIISATLILGTIYVINLFI